jgi:hypothetical protein
MYEDTPTEGVNLNEKTYWSDKPTNDEQKPFPLFTSLSSMRSTIGHGTYSYFFLLQALIVVFAIMLVPSISAMIINHKGGKLNGVANVTTFRTLSLENNTTVPWSISLCDLLSTLVFMIFLVYMRFYFPKIKRKQNVSDFTVKITNVPHNVTEKELENFFSLYGKINQICIALNNGKLIEKMQKHDALLEKLEEYKNDGKEATQKRGRTLFWFGGDNMETITFKIENSQQEIDALQVINYQCCGIAFITFENRSSADECIHNMARNIFKKPELLFRESVTLYATPAPENHDIVWENLQYDFKSRLLRRVLAAGVTNGFAVLTILLAVFIGTWVFRARFSGQASPPGFVLGILIPLAIFSMLTLIIMAKVLSKFEKHHAKSHEKLFECTRLTTYEMVLGTILPNAMFHFLWEYVGTSRLQQDLMPQIGVVIEVCIVVILINLVIPFLYRTIVWYVTVRKARTEHYLKRKFVSAEFPIGEVHKLLVKTVFTCLYFSALAPIMNIVTFLALVLIYVVDRYNIARRFKKTETNDNTISVVMVRYFLPIGVIAHFGVGTRLYYLQDKESHAYMNMLIPMLAFTVLYLLSISYDIVMFIGSFLRTSYDRSFSEEDELAALTGEEKYGPKYTNKE